MSLPKWIEYQKTLPLYRRMTTAEFEANLKTAVLIAHQALETLKASVTGDCYLGQEKEIAIVDEALRRIASLGDPQQGEEGK